MFDLFYKNSPLRGSLSAILVITTIFSVGGWVLFEPKPVQAFGDVIGGPSQVISTIMDALRWAWEKVQAAYSYAADKIKTAYILWQKSDTLLARASRVAAQIAIHTLLNMLTNDIIKWIQDGGEPRFISNWEGFLKDAGNKAGGLFVDKYLGAGWLCEPFDIAIKIPLLKVPTFDEKVKCTLEDMGINIRMFLDDFEEGGWAGWIELTKPQGNFYGGYLIAQTEKINREEAAKDAAGQEGGAGRGFLSVKVCVKGYTEDYDTGETDETCSGSGDCEDLEDSAEDDINYLFVCEKEEVSTPASVLSDVTSRAIDRPMESLSRQVADLTDSLGSYAPYIIAISNALINRVIEEGLAKIQSTGPSSDEPDQPMPPGPPITSIDSPAQAEATAEIAGLLLDQQELLKENLETRLSPQQESNLGVMQDIEATQGSILTKIEIIFKLSNLGQPDCSLPSWANSQITDESTEPSPDPEIQTDKTIKIFQITVNTVDDVGSISIKKTTWQQWDDCAIETPDGVCFADWVPRNVFETLETTMQMTDQLTTLEEDIEETNQQIIDIDLAIASTNGLIQAAEEYIDFYETIHPEPEDELEVLEPPTDEEQAALDVKKDAIETALDLLIIDGRTAVQSSADNTMKLTNDTQDFSMAVNQAADALLVDRGLNETYPEKDSFYAQKQALQGKLSAAEDIHLDCTPPPPEENGNGNGP